MELGDGLKKLLLAGVGTVAVTAREIQGDPGRAG